MKKVIGVLAIVGGLAWLSQTIIGGGCLLALGLFLVATKSDSGGGDTEQAPPPPPPPPPPTGPGWQDTPGRGLWDHNGQ